jgi:hypothetical protein
VLLVIGAKWTSPRYRIGAFIGKIVEIRMVG